jgi:hypothetical protein
VRESQRWIIELTLPYVSVASGGDEYFQVSFDARPEGTDGDTPHFLLQRQFESPDRGRVYVECHQRELCGHVRVSHAVLSGDLLRLELATRPPHVVAIRFKADNRRVRQLTAMLSTIIGVRHLELASGGSHRGK